MDETKNQDLPELDFTSAWKSCADQMKFAFEVPDSQAEEQPLASQQSRYVLAIMSFAFFLDQVGQRDIAHHFHFLAEAMNDLGDGIPHPLFSISAPDGKGGRKQDTSAVWRTRSIICVGIESMKAGGVTEEDAIKQISKVYRRALVNLLRPSAGLESSIRTWMKSFANDEVRNEIALSTYKQGLSGLSLYRSKFTGEELRLAGERLVSDAAKRASSLVRN